METFGNFVERKYPDFLEEQNFPTTPRIGSTANQMPNPYRQSNIPLTNRQIDLMHQAGHDPVYGINPVKITGAGLTPGVTHGLGALERRNPPYLQAIGNKYNIEDLHFETCELQLSQGGSKIPLSIKIVGDHNGETMTLALLKGKPYFAPDTTAKAVINALIRYQGGELNLNKGELKDISSMIRCPSGRAAPQQQQAQKPAAPQQQQAQKPAAPQQQPQPNSYFEKQPQPINKGNIPPDQYFEKQPQPINKGNIPFGGFSQPNPYIEKQPQSIDSEFNKQNLQKQISKTQSLKQGSKNYVYDPFKARY